MNAPGSHEECKMVSSHAVLARKHLEDAKAHCGQDDWMRGMLDGAITCIEAAVGVSELAELTCVVCGDVADHLDNDGEPACAVCEETYATVENINLNTDADAAPEEQSGAFQESVTKPELGNECIGFDPVALGI